jgi:hypothetical protein
MHNLQCLVHTHAVNAGWPWQLVTPGAQAAYRMHSHELSLLSKNENFDKLSSELGCQPLYLIDLFIVLRAPITSHSIVTDSQPAKW